MGRIVPAALMLAPPVLIAPAGAARAAEIKVVCSSGLREVLIAEPLRRCNLLIAVDHRMDAPR